jgi:hypothetical protein
MDAKVTPPDFAAMRRQIEAAGRDAMNPAGELDAAKRKALFARALEEVRLIRVDAIKWQRYFKRNQEAAGKAKKVRHRVERRLAQLIIAMNDAGFLSDGRAIPGYKIGTLPPNVGTLDDHGIDKDESKEWLKLARMSDEEFELWLDKPRKKRRSRDMDYPLHPITGDYDDFTEAELEALRQSLRKHGLRVPVVIWREQIVDGRHRDRVCKEEGIPRRYNDVTKECKTEAEMRAHVAALNEHRRANTKPLTTAEKRARIEAALKANAERPNQQIAKEIGVSHHTVGDVRSDLEGRGQIANVETRRDTKGRRQPSRKSKRASNRNQKPPAAPRDAAEPELPFQPAPVLEATAKPGNREAVSSDDDALVPATQGDAAPSAGPSEPAPRLDPHAINRAGVRGCIIGLVKLKDEDLGPVAVAMPREQLIEARAELDEAARTIGNWRAALDAAIERAMPVERTATT